jgi:glycosyltransferase involved in cell wall biosynthesis
MRKKSVSVAMAVYNGEAFLHEQIDSILCQLSDLDELVISYDNSDDSTLKIIEDYARKDKRVKFYINEDHSKGLVSNFNNALKFCTGDIIFYSDQDDYWMPDKIDEMVRCFDEPDVTVVIHDAMLVDSNKKIISDSTFKLRGGARNTLLGNLIRLSYIGCCMAFRNDMLTYIMPLPTNRRSHDWWTGCICMCFGKMAVVNRPLIMHRIHDNNATPKKRPSIGYQIKVRAIIIIQIFYRTVIKRKKVDDFRRHS